MLGTKIKYQVSPESTLACVESGHKTTWWLVDTTLVPVAPGVEVMPCQVVKVKSEAVEVGHECRG